MADTDTFQVVRGKKARKLRRPPTQANNITQGKEGNEYFDFHKFKCRLIYCIQELSLSEFFMEVYGNIETALSQVTEDRFGYPAKKTSEPTAGVSEPGETIDSVAVSNMDGKSSEAIIAPSVTESSSSSQSYSENLQSTEGLKEVQLLSYGIGSFTSCLIARYQLAFLLALRDKLGDRCTSCCVYDPIFSSQEIQVLETYKCQVISENEEGKRVCPGPTIAFMPHCGKALYNNLLWRNLTSEKCQGLYNLVLIGNSFSSMLERTPERILHKTASYVIKLQPYTEEAQLANIFTHSDVFNDLAIHTFPRCQLEPVLDQICHSLPEPVYEQDDAEFISK